jgi:hypothetical protein
MQFAVSGACSSQPVCTLGCAAVTSSEGRHNKRGRLESESTTAQQQLSSHVHGSEGQSIPCTSS